MAWTWGFIGEQREWHVYTAKSAKHDGGIFSAKPICGQKAFGTGGSDSRQMSQVTQSTPPVNSPHDICSTCMAKWKLKQKGKP